VLIKKYVSFLETLNVSLLGQFRSKQMRIEGNVHEKDSIGEAFFPLTHQSTMMTASQRFHPLTRDHIPCWHAQKQGAAVLDGESDWYFVNDLYCNHLSPPLEKFLTTLGNGRK